MSHYNKNNNILGSSPPCILISSIWPLPLLCTQKARTIMSSAWQGGTLHLPEAPKKPTYSLPPLRDDAIFASLEGGLCRKRRGCISAVDGGSGETLREKPEDARRAHSSGALFPVNKR